MKPTFVTKKLIQLMPKVGGQLIVEPNYKYSGCIIFDNGNRTFYKGASFDINPSGAVKIAIDKGYTNYFLQHFGFSIPTFDTFANENLNKYLKKKKGIYEGFDFASKLGFPVIIKPNDGDKGKHVYKVHKKTEYFEYAQRLFVDAQVMLIQQFVIANDYRIVVFDDKVYCAYQRIPLALVGNGKDTIKQLLKEKEKQLKQQRGVNTFNLEDVRIQTKLGHENLSIDDIPSEGTVIPLLNLANLSLGGTAIDYTNKISEAYKKLAVDIAQKMGLRFCGIDMMTDSIEGDVDNYSIIEINSSPGQRNFSRLGETQSTIVDDLYFDILMALKNKDY